MKLSITRRTACLISAALLVTGCATTYEGPHSGFLPQGDYAIVHKDEHPPAGGDRYIYVNGKFTPGNYDAIILDSLRFYPEAEPNEYVTADTLRQIREYADESLRSKVGAKVRLVSSPGPGVAHWKTALTAAGAEKRALKPYQYVPIALVITGAKAAAEGGLPLDSSIAYETEITDSVNNETLAVVIRGGTGEQVESNEQGQKAVTFNDVKKLIDTWTDGAAAQITNYVRAK